MKSKRTIDMSQTLNRNLLDPHPLAGGVMFESLVVSYNAFLYIASRSTRARLLASTLASFTTKLFSCTAKAKLAAADIERTLAAGILCVLAALSMCIAVAPADVVGRLPRCAAVFFPKATVARLATACAVCTRLVLSTAVLVSEE
jgi:hypothetical protein